MSQDEKKNQSGPADAHAPDTVTQAGSAAEAAAAPEAAAADAAAGADGSAKTAQKPAADKKDARAAALEKELAGLREKFSGAEKELAGARDTLLRTAAEYDNYRKRTTREKDAAFSNGVAFALTQLLPVIDALELAAAAECSDESYKKGVGMTLTKCTEALTKLGITEIEAEGKPFDPALHSAVLQQKADDAHPSGTVAQVLQKGYRLGDKVIRHAAVAVSA